MDALQVQVSQIIIQVIFYSGIVVPAVLALFWKWWRSELGWSIVAKTLALSLALFGTMLIYWFGPNGVTRSPEVQWFTLAMLALVPVIIWWRVWVIWKTQRDGTRHHLRTPPATDRSPAMAYPVEPKTQAAGVTAAVSGAVLWLLGTYVFKGSVPDGIASMIYVAVPGVLAFAAAWLAPHQHRDPAPALVLPAQPAPADEPVVPPAP